MSETDSKESGERGPQIETALSEIVTADAGATRDDVVQNGSVGYAAAYVLLTGSTQWLGVLPPIPDGLGEPLTAALATLIGCVLFHTRRALGIRKMQKGG